jgi:uncharacterized protein YjiS (DUF1127 family)
MSSIRHIIGSDSPARSWRGLRIRLVRAVERVQLWQERAHERHALASLDDHILKDIGVTRSEVNAEAAKPFWKA